MWKWGIPGLLLASLGLATYLWWRQPPSTPSVPALSDVQPVSMESEQRVREFCAGCHAAPDPGLFPQDAWHAEVVRGYRFYAQSGKHNLDPPPIEQAVRYYVGNAPAKLEMPDTVSEEADGQTWFEKTAIEFHSPFDMQSGIGHVARGFTDRQVIAADMASGYLWLAELGADATSQVRPLIRLDYPCNLRWSDLDQDGQEDLLVADLGGFYADDRQAGKIVWLRRTGPESFDAPVVLLDGIGRACDVRSGDFNDDGLLDLVIAEFGWLNTGGIHLLLRKEPSASIVASSFEHHVLDERAGAIHVIPTDVDQDGSLDILALMSQQYEQVLYFPNLPDVPLQSSQPAVLWEAQDPGFGSSGIQQVDFDADGDLDLLYTHGDTFDGPYVKPSHGLHWLENKGNQEYVPHRLAHMAGAYSAAIADWDEDGDLDVAISAWLPRQTHQFDRSQAVSLLLLERTTENQFKKHVLERGNPSRSSIRFVDMDADGDLDLVAGRDEEALRKPVLVDVWLNRHRD